MDLSGLTDSQLMALKASGGDLSKVPDEVLHALKAGGSPERKGQQAVTGPNDAISSFGTGVAQGGTLGYADELGATVRAALPGFSNMMMSKPALQRDESIGGGNEPPAQTVSTAPTFDARYTEELARLRAQAAADKEAHPYATGAGQLVGNIGVGVAALPAAGAGASVLHNVAKFAAAGGALGAAQGFGEGEGGFGNRVGNALTEGGMGALGGAAVPVGGAIVNKGVESLGVPAMRKLAAMLEGVAPKVTPQSLSAAAPEGGQVAADSIATRLSDLLQGKANSIEKNAAIRNIGGAMLRQKSTPEELQATLGQLGSHGMLADLGPGMSGAANAARLESPEIKNLSQTVLAERAKQYGPMLTEAAGAQNVPSLYEAGKMFGTGPKDIGAYPRHVGADLYGEMRAQGLNMSPEMQGIIDKTPSVRNAIEQIRADYAEAGKVPTPIELMDKVKQKLNKTAEAKFNSGTAVDKGLVGGTADDFERAFWAANPTAETASHGYANANSLRDYVDMGRRFRSEGTTPGAVEVSAQSVADALRNPKPYQQGAYALGVQNDIRTAAQANPTNLARGLTPEKLGIVDKLTQALGPQGAEKVLNAANAVRTFQGTANKLAGGSSTVPNLSDMAAVGNARLNLGKSGITERLTEHLSDIIGHIEKPNEKTLAKMGELLMTPNAAENQDVIEALKKLHATHARTSAAKAAAGSSVFTQAGH